MVVSLGAGGGGRYAVGSSAPEPISLVEEQKNEKMLDLREL